MLLAKPSRSTSIDTVNVVLQVSGFTLKPAQMVSESTKSDKNSRRKSIAPT